MPLYGNGSRDSVLNVFTIVKGWGVLHSVLPVGHSVSDPFSKMVKVISANPNGLTVEVQSNFRLGIIHPTKFVTKWGSRGSGDGQFDSPQGIAVDSSNNIYVVGQL